MTDQTETESTQGETDVVWYRVAGDLAEGRVTTVTVGRRSLALTRHEGL